MSTKQRTISAKDFYEKLQSLDACDEALQFAKGKTFRQAYDQCNSPEWMLWLLGRSWIDKKVIQLIAVEFAETCASNAKDYPEVSECITVTKRYLDGKATRQELGAAESTAESAASAAWSPAESAAMLNQCNIIRKHVPYDLIANLLFPERTVTA